MFLSLSVLSLSLCAFLYFLALLATRNPRPSLWANDTVMSCIITPLIVGLFTLGIAGIVQSFFPGKHPSTTDLATAGAIAVITVALYLILGLPKKLARYKEGDVSGNIVEVDFNASSRKGNDRPTLPSSGKLRKAA